MCDDICSLDYLDDETVLSNLKIRFQKKNVYTYASNVLIFINPYEIVENLYGPKQLSRYLTKESLFKQLPPHIYSTANEAMNNLKLFKRKQSIIITGVSGSGKTENCKHIVNFLCQASNSQNVVDSGFILEAFGNARTHRNTNSSRFCKNIELFFNEDMQQSGSKISYHLLEVHRACTTNPNESNFHVFYTLLHGSPKDLLNNICLDKTTYYRYLPDIDSVCKINNNTCLDINFNLLEENLSKIGFTVSDKKNIYSVLSAILNLANIEFETINSDESCSIKIESRKYLCNTAALLNLNEVELEDTLTSHTREVGSQRVISPLTKTEAENTRDSLAKFVYEKLFSQIVQYINNHLFQSSSSDYSIGILDIAGFEYFTEAYNTFDQLCINYSNERMQNFFVDIMLLMEKQWYDGQNLDEPFIDFLNNSHIIDLFHNKTKGIFTLLNDECKLPTPSIQNFARNLMKWEKDVVAPISLNIQGRQSESIFMIRHFANNVVYSTCDFVEKNKRVPAKNIRLLVSKARGLFEKSDNKSESGSKTTASALRCEVDNLINKLKNTNTHFIRCILPNNEKQNEKIDEGLILKQLYTSSTVSYAKFIRFGYPKRIDLQKLVVACEPIKKKLEKVCVQSNFYSKVLLSLGFKLNDFRIGNDLIFFRSNKFHLIEKFFSELISVSLPVKEGRIEDPRTTTISTKDPLLHQERRKPKSLSEKPLERIEGYVWRSKWNCILTGFQFLMRLKHATIKKKSSVSKADGVLETQTNRPIEKDAQKPLLKHPLNHPTEEPANLKLDNILELQMNRQIEKDRKKPLLKRPPNGPNEEPARKRNKTEKRPPIEMRFDKMEHFPEMHKCKPVRCKFEDCHYKSRVFCIKCKVHLCLTEDRNCFKNFHYIGKENLF